MAFFTMLFSCNTKGQLESIANAGSGIYNEDDVSGVFDDAKPGLSHVANIASKNEPGERIKITGIVYESDGKTPAKNVKMYFYHTNAEGIYAKRGDEPKNSFAWWHGYNRGWLITNEHGEYEINTIKPAPYPAMVEPAHIHVIVTSPKQKQAYDVGAITFKGDKLATPEYWYKVEQNGHPRDGGTQLSKNAQGILEGKRNFILYAQYDKDGAQSGLLPGEECPAFSPRHAFGKDKSSKACPMCKYGYKQGVMAWINNDDWLSIKKLGQFLETKIAENGFDNMQAFIIYMNPGKLNPAEIDFKLNELAKNAGLKNVALLYVPSPGDSKTSALYRLNPGKQIKNTVFIYKERRVIDKFINLDDTSEQLSMLMSSLNRSISKQNL
jgi:protocatechuate 3,4-dioxygenase beta subunit